MTPVHNFVTFMECINRPNAACLSSGPSLLLYGLFLAAVVWGFLWFVRDRALFRRRAKTTSLLALALIFGSFFVVILFAGLNPDTFTGVEDSFLLNTLWVITIFAFGFGLLMGFAALGLGIGGLAAKITRRGPTT